ncbi:hypothetical protein [Akkermansia massiliensis]
MSTCSVTREVPGMLAAANEWIELTVRMAGRRLAEVTFTDKLNGCTYRLGDDIFSLPQDYRIKEDRVTAEAPLPRPLK